jgi:hypothetical protein
MKTVRVILGAVVGVGLAFLIVVLAEEAGHRIYPVPTDIDWSDVNAVKSYTDSLPVGALLLLLAGWVGATFIGALAGSAICRPRAILISVIVGGLMLAATIVNFLMTPHPWWLVMATIIGIAGATWLAAKLLWKPVLPPTSA